MDRLYLYSLLALRIGRTGIEVAHRAGQLRARSEADAHAQALRLCRLLFAPDEGFAHHSVALCPAPASAGEVVSVLALD